MGRPQDKGASADADRATRASTEPASGLGRSAGIPSAAVTQANLSEVPDEVLAAAIDRARRLVRALEAADLADIGVSRYEIDTAASDRVLTQNFMRLQGARRVLSRIEAEADRRDAITRARGERP